MTDRLLAAFLAVACMVADAAFLERRHHRPQPSFVALDQETLAVAASLYDGGGFADPYFSAKTGPTSHVAPVYPFILALTFDLAGGPLKGACWAMYLPYVARILEVGILFWAVRQFCFSNVAALVVTLFYAYLPQRIAGGWEAELTSLELLVLFLMALKSARNGRPSTPFVISFGGLFTVLILTNPGAALGALGAVVVASIYRDRFAALKPLAALAGCLLIGIFPWIFHLYKVSGVFVPVRGNFGLELAISNNDYAQSRYPANWGIGSFTCIHPIVSEVSIRRIRAIGDTAFFHEQQKTATQWIRKNPRHFLHLTWLHVRNILHGLSEDKKMELIVMLLFGLTAAALLAGKNRWPLVAIMFGIGLCLLPYAFIQSDPRYFQPVLPFLVFSGFVAIVELVRVWMPGWLKSGNTPFEIHIASPQLAVLFATQIIGVFMALFLYRAYHRHAESDIRRRAQVELYREASLLLRLQTGFKTFKLCASHGLSTAVDEESIYTDCVPIFTGVRGTYALVRGHLADTDHAAEIASRISAGDLIAIEAAHEKLRAVADAVDEPFREALLESPCANTDRQRRIRRALRAIQPGFVD